MYKKRRRRRKNDKLRIIIYMIPLLCVIVAGIGVVRAFTTDGNKIQQEEPGAEKLSPNSEKDISNDTPTEEDETDGTLTDVKQDDTNSPSTEQDDSKNTDDEDEQTDDAKEFTLADLDNPQGFDERPTEHGIVLENEQIDLSGLDTTCLDWGQGGDLDEYNRPAGCMQYQEKYGMYNAYFIKDEPEKKVIYLTMDEGYEYGCSSRILDTLKEKKDRKSTRLNSSHR